MTDEVSPPPTRLADRCPGGADSSEARHFVLAAPLPVVALLGMVALGFVAAGVESARYLAQPSVTATVAGVPAGGGRGHHDDLLQPAAARWDVDQSG
jgi:hypothetical protein